MDNYDLKINIKSLDIDPGFHKNLKRIQTKLREIKTVDGSMAQDGSQMYDKLTLRQNTTINIFDNSYFRVIARSQLDLENIRDIQKISGFECDHVSINQDGNLEVSFHDRRKD